MKLLELYQDKVWGAISGLDRIRFRGTLRWLASARGLTTMMGHLGILLKDFGGWVDGMTAKVRASCASQAQALGIPVQYLSSSSVDKEQLARQIAAERGVTAPACNRMVKEGKRYRGLNPWQKEDFRLLMFLAKGEHTINGFRNGDLCRWLFPSSEPDRRKADAGRTTRRIRLLRAHGLIRKVPRANRYVLTDKGRTFSVALMTASALEIKELTDRAA